jgi:phosphatidylglycerophosphatase A
LTTSRPDSQPDSRPDWRFVTAHPAHFLAFGFGAGLSPRAPGTVGSLAAFPVYALLSLSPSAWYWAWVVLALVAGVWICDVAGRALGVADHGGIVWDEIAAMLLVLPFAPAGWVGWLAAFALFRLFDIVKPWPIGWLDRHVKGGLGVMLDDVLAALYAVICLRVIESWM